MWASTPEGRGYVPTIEFISSVSCFCLGWDLDRYMDDTLTKDKMFDDPNAFKSLYVNLLHTAKQGGFSQDFKGL